ncbi:hypothetical protein [Microbacterium galbinum]|uniref:Uncharacterized protein n=1 Tax=Microbacterium galbinum TaxID=2851646 RepID=A0ABY4ISS4_9MICO|nr:hypothetical protein [Microbacterium galbinum]UPL15689.1 hypothetical protein KV396_14905 [Microbacterium galbinum]
MTTTTPDTRHDIVHLALVVKDARGFTHYYEQLATTPAAVREAYDLMARAAQDVPASQDVPSVDALDATDAVLARLGAGGSRFMSRRVRKTKKDS